MKLGENLNQYREEILENVLHYAYENHLPQPILTTAIPKWHGEIFEVANIERELHQDLIDDLKVMRVEDYIDHLYKITNKGNIANIRSNFYDYIVKNFDKYVILPDVFSQDQLPIEKIRTLPGELSRNEYDLNRRNIVIINGKLLELNIDPEMGHFYLGYNHNQKFYFFYKDSEFGSIFNTPSGKTASIYSIFIKDHGFTIDRINWNDFRPKVTDPDEGLMLYLDENNKVVDNVNPARKPKVAGLYIDVPFIKIDYTDINQSTIPEKPGLMSLGWRDMEMQPKWYNQTSDKFFIQDIESLMSTTAVVIMKDNSYIVEDLYVNHKGKYVERVDKHTMILNKSEDVREVYIFIQPYYRHLNTRPDDLYYNAIKSNPWSAVVLKDVRPKTSELYNKMKADTDFSVEDAIKYGYEKDVDVLKVIQKTFPSLVKLSKYDSIISQYLGEMNESITQYIRIWHRDIRDDLSAYLADELNGRTPKNDLNFRVFNNAIKELNDKGAASEVLLILDFLNYCDELTGKRFNDGLTRLYSRFKAKLDMVIDGLTRLIDLADDGVSYINTKDFKNRLVDIANMEEDRFFVMSKVRRKDTSAQADYIFHFPKILVPVKNPLQKYPALFINHTLYPIDYKIIKHWDMDILVVDPKDFYRCYVDDDMSIFKKTKLPKPADEYPIVIPKTAKIVFNFGNGETYTIERDRGTEMTKAEVLEELQPIVGDNVSIEGLSDIVVFDKSKTVNLTLVPIMVSITFIVNGTRNVVRYQKGTYKDKQELRGIIQGFLPPHLDITSYPDGLKWAVDGEYVIGVKKKSSTIKLYMFANVSRIGERPSTDKHFDLVNIVARDINTKTFTIYNNNIEVRYENNYTVFRKYALITFNTDADLYEEKVKSLLPSFDASVFEKYCYKFDKSTYGTLIPSTLNAKNGMNKYNFIVGNTMYHTFYGGLDWRDITAKAVMFTYNKLKDLNNTALSAELTTSIIGVDELKNTYTDMTNISGTGVGVYTKPIEYATVTFVVNGRSETVTLVKGTRKNAEEVKAMLTRLIPRNHTLTTTEVVWDSDKTVTYTTSPIQIAVTFNIKINQTDAPLLTKTVYKDYGYNMQASEVSTILAPYIDANNKRLDTSTLVLNDVLFDRVKTVDVFIKKKTWNITIKFDSYTSKNPVRIIERGVSIPGKLEMSVLPASGSKTSYISIKLTSDYNGKINDIKNVFPTFDASTYRYTHIYLNQVSAPAYIDRFFTIRDYVGDMTKNNMYTNGKLTTPSSHSERGRIYMDTDWKDIVLEYVKYSIYKIESSDNNDFAVNNIIITVTFEGANESSTHVDISSSGVGVYKAPNVDITFIGNGLTKVITKPKNATVTANNLKTELANLGFDNKKHYKLVTEDTTWDKNKTIYLNYVIDHDQTILGYDLRVAAIDDDDKVYADFQSIHSYAPVFVADGVCNSGKYKAFHSNMRTVFSEGIWTSSRAVVFHTENTVKVFKQASNIVSNIVGFVPSIKYYSTPSFKYLGVRVRDLKVYKYVNNSYVEISSIDIDKIYGYSSDYILVRNAEDLNTKTRNMLIVDNFEANAIEIFNKMIELSKKIKNACKVEILFEVVSSVSVTNFNNYLGNKYPFGETDSKLADEFTTMSGFGGKNLLQIEFYYRTSIANELIVNSEPVVGFKVASELMDIKIPGLTISSSGHPNISTSNIYKYGDNYILKLPIGDTNYANEAKINSVWVNYVIDLNEYLSTKTFLDLKNLIVKILRSIAMVRFKNVSGWTNSIAIKNDTPADSSSENISQYSYTRYIPNGRALTLNDITGDKLIGGIEFPKVGSIPASSDIFYNVITDLSSFKDIEFPAGGYGRIVDTNLWSELLVHNAKVMMGKGITKNNIFKLSFSRATKYKASNVKYFIDYDKYLAYLDPNKLVAAASAGFKPGINNTLRTRRSISADPQSIKDYREPIYKAPKWKDTPDRDLLWIENMWHSKVKDLRVVFTDWTEMNDGDITHEHGRLTSDPYYPYLTFDSNTTNDNKSLYFGTPFVNGYLSKDYYLDNEYQPKLTNIVYPYGLGPLNFDNRANFTDDINDISVINTKIVISNKTYRYSSGKEAPFFGISRVNLGEVTFCYQPMDETTLQKLQHKLKRDSNVVVFNKLGQECTDDVNILSRDYVDMNDLGNTVTLDTYDNRCVSIYTPSMKSTMYDYDLEIDESRVASDNVSYNDRALGLNKDIEGQETILQLFDYNPSAHRISAPYENATDLYDKACTVRYTMNDRNFLKQDSTAMEAEVNSLGKAYRNILTPTKMYNPIDIFISQRILHKMLIDSGKTYIQDETVHIDCAKEYEYPEDVYSSYTPTYFLPTKNNTLVYTYNNTIITEVE